MDANLLDLVLVLTVVLVEGEPGIEPRLRLHVEHRWVHAAGVCPERSLHLKEW